MFDYILYPTDFSKPSLKAFEYVKRLKNAGMQKVLLLHVVDKREVSTMATMEGFSSTHYPDIIEDVRKEMTQKAEKEIEKLTSELKAMDVKVVQRIVYGIPFEVIINEAESEKVSCIVIGSHGKSLVTEMLLGSTSEKVVRKAKCPVFVVK
ncbi:universal stress protein [bacterium]|nr:universal stress protein [bacterium]